MNHPQLESCPRAVLELVERFERNRDAYFSDAYNEARLRVEFVNPFFEALGWDVDNRHGYAEAYKDVIHEDAIAVGSATKAPDYCFRVGGARKFFVETKKPAVPISRDPLPAYQLRRYAWSAKLPLSVLTDFEELALYDCRLRPSQNDKPAKGRVLHCRYDEYADRWTELAGVLSREAVLRGDFDRFITTTKKARGTAEVDDAFLAEIESWRDLLARNFALRNQLTVRELNYAVQCTIDRIIFLRMCEDRGIERYGQLRTLVNGDGAYRKLFELFERADDRYNSGLFHFHPERGRTEPADELTPNLKLDDKPLKEILRGLYYPESPYEFSVLPADVLGQVYEQFLGKVIRLTRGGYAKVEDKPEVKKAGGVYYTPTYIVDYIVKNTVGKLLGEVGSGVSGFGFGVSESDVKGASDAAEDVSRAGGVEEGHGPRGGGVSPGADVPGRGEVRPGEPGAEGGGLDSGQRGRGLRSEPSGGLPASPVDGPRLPDGGGDPPAASPAPPVRRATRSTASLGPDTTSRPHAHEADRIPPSPQTPTPNPQTLTPKDVRRLRILDPACGSGSFLVAAYGYLLDWHRDWYLADGPEKHRKVLYQGKGGQWYLTTAEKKRILLENIYGVDIDPQAVEVTKLSLLLKVLEGATREVLENQRRLFQERALPDLSSNIKCGNSLIAPDFYDRRQLTLLDDEDHYRINAFDWQAEFPKILKAGGFDAVIGNPPYIRMEAFKGIKDYLREHYTSHDERTDFYVYFVERGHDLLRKSGRFGMIVSNKFLRARYGEKLRNRLNNVATIERLVDLAGLPVFRGATVRTVVLNTQKAQSEEPMIYSPPPTSEDFVAVEGGTVDLDAATAAIAYAVPRRQIRDEKWDLSRPDHNRLMARLRQHKEPLVSVVGGQICMGIKSGCNAAFVIGRETRDAILAKNSEARAILRPFIQGRDVRRYHLTPRDEYLIYTHHGIDMRPFPAVLEHLKPFRRRLEGRATKQEWYELQQPQYAYVRFLESPKIVFPDIATTCRFALDSDGHFGANTVYFLPTADRRLLGLLNSKLAHFYFQQTCAALEGPGESYLRFFGQYLEGFPVVPLKSLGKRKGRRLDELVGEMEALHKKLATVRTPGETNRLHRTIAATDRQIDQLVYELYGLTDQEIALVEETH